MADGLTDDYVFYDGNLPEAQRKDKAVLCVPSLGNYEVISHSLQEVPNGSRRRRREPRSDDSGLRGMENVSYSLRYAWQVANVFVGGCRSFPMPTQTR